MNISRCRARAAALATATALVLVGGCGGEEEDTAGPETGWDIEDIHTDHTYHEDEFMDHGEEFAQPTKFVGMDVTVSAQVSEVIGPNALLIADEPADPLLIVYDGVAKPQKGTAVMVQGTVLQTFEVDAAERLANVDLNEARLSKFRTQPYIHAKKIILEPKFAKKSQ